MQVNTTVTICQTLATAMGPKINQHVRVIAPGLISVFGDTKVGEVHEREESGR